MIVNIVLAGILLGKIYQIEPVSEFGWTAIIVFILLSVIISEIVQSFLYLLKEY